VDSTYALAFIESVQNVFGMMLQLPLETGEPYARDADDPCHDVSGIIGMSGDVEGSVALSFDTATAERVVSLMTGVDFEQTHEEFADTIGELANMVAGGAKARFDGKTVNISCPSVVLGSGHQVFTPKDARHIVIPCHSDCGTFTIELTIRPTNANQAAAPTDAAA